MTREEFDAIQIGQVIRFDSPTESFIGEVTAREAYGYKGITLIYIGGTVRRRCDPGHPAVFDVSLINHMTLIE